MSMSSKMFAALPKFYNSIAGAPFNVGGVIDRQAQWLLALLPLVLCLIWQFSHKAGHTTYLLDFHCFVIPERWRFSNMRLLDQFRDRKVFSDDSFHFQQKLFSRSGLGNVTGYSDGILAVANGDGHSSLAAALSESAEVIFDVTQNVLDKTGISPQEIGIVMVSCSCFAPTPSMAAMLVNRFRMDSNVLTYSLAGMGCSSSVVCVDMARHLLKALPNTVALIVNHENITENFYSGNDTSMQLANSLFRAGGAAAIVSNRRRDARMAKYELVTTHRTHLGAEDDAFGCMGVREDQDGIQGVFLKKNVIEVSGRALALNLKTLVPRVLPWLELARAVTTKDYRPDFGYLFDHFLLHTGGRGVLDGLEKNLRLSEHQMKPARETLSKFGNTSAASTWYILAWLESSRGIAKNDRLWQLGFGGGFKACSAVWKAKRAIKQPHSCWSEAVGSKEG